MLRMLNSSQLSELQPDLAVSWFLDLMYKLYLASRYNTNYIHALNLILALTTSALLLIPSRDSDARVGTGVGTAAVLIQGGQIRILQYSVEV
jgi:hypothetical protein